MDKLPVHPSALYRLLRRKPAAGAGFLCLAGLAALLLWPEPRVDFNRDIRPILNNRCIACHGGVKQAGGFSLLFRSDALDTTESGKYAIVPGDPGKSELIRRIVHNDPDERMPPNAHRLPDREIQLLKRWIKQGAEWEDHWAYIKPQPKALPEVSDRDWPANGIDHFILARLDREGLKPAPEADCATLARRASLDLIGLPPTPDEVDAFCTDTSPGAYEKLIDRLLASNHFGEHWAAMWLDLARYADTKGYEKDAHRTIWKYRDWVIDAFNRDLPFDQFTIEQLAGDLIPGATDEQILATAFHRNTTTNDEGGTDNEEFRTAAVLDRVNTTWEVWQGTTMACVQCHSHPYDPFRHEEYFRFLAFFNNTADADWADENPRIPTYGPAEQKQIEKILAWLDEHGAGPDSVVTGSLWERVEKTLYPNERIAASSYDAFENVYSENEFTSPGRDGAFARYSGIDLTGVEEIAINHRTWGNGGGIDVRIGALDGPRIAFVPLSRQEDGRAEGVARVPIEPVEGKQDLYFVFRRPDGASYRLHWFAFSHRRPDVDPALRQAVREKLNALAAIPPEVDTPALKELPASRRRKTHVFERGNWMVKGAEVQPGVPASLPPLPEDAPPDRLAMAKWIASEENPLTARVAVNRFWAQIFGTGIIETPEDFGSQGAPPSHPELLDWLALQFMHEHGWSIKSLLKQIVMSSTYRQSSRVTPEKLEKDPGNRLLARAPRVRLSAEQVRDQALAVSGLLSEKMYGPSVMPPQPPGLWLSPYNSADWVTAEGEDRYRRAVYTYWKRTAPYPSMVAFDSPTRDFCVSRRIRTNTPLQALVTLNDPVYVEASQALARRMAAAGRRPEDRIEAGYRMALARKPDEQALARLKQLYEESATYYANNPDKLKPAVTPYMPYDTTSTTARGANRAVEALTVAPVFQAEPEDSVDLAALTVVAGAIMNLDAFLTRE